MTGAALLAVALLGAPPAAPTAGATLPELQRRLQAEATRAGGTVGVSVLHLPSGRRASVEGARPLPLYSVFKLPVAMAVLAEAQAGKLALDRKIRVTAADVSPGGTQNTARWQKTPVELDLRQLLELSLGASDNTANDKLLALVGGPRAVMRRLGAWGLDGFDIQFSSRQQRQGAGLNRGSAEAVTRLLARLQAGELLAAPQRSLLLEFMSHASPGMKRLRGALPPGTAVANKTGTGGDGAACNDVGLITLPGGGQIAVAVLFSGSKLPLPEQEKLIAALARIAYDEFAKGR